MSVLDDILKGISPVMGAYREKALKELVELCKDRERLEWLIKAKFDYCEHPGFDTPRAAIDAAMEAAKGD